MSTHETRVSIDKGSAQDSAQDIIQDTKKMVCTNCAFPLDRLSGAQSKVCCPRCNTWLDIDPNCGGSCLACHKTLKASQNACLETSLVKSKENAEISCESGVRKDQRTLISGFIKVVGKARKYLSSRFIL